MKWIFIYGPGRTGSTYLLRIIREVSKCSVSDWGLGSILKPFKTMPNGIDKKRFLEDLARNLIDSSRRNEKGQIDLVIKSATGNADEFDCYEKMFGPAERIIFTIREPSGYMASAAKKFPNLKIEDLQISYLRMISLFPDIQGEIFNYCSNLKIENYLKFLTPLKFDKNKLEKFEFKGGEALQLTTREMHVEYKRFLQLNRDLVFKV